MKTHQNAASPLFMGGGGDLSPFYNKNRIRFYIAFVSMILSINQSMAQVTSLKVGSSPTIINPSAALEVESSSKGVLLPRVALTGTADVTTILSPTASMLVYNTATAGTAPNNVTPGYYYWSGAAWTRFTTGTPSADWTLTGNAGSVAGTNFMGTTDAVDFVTKTNNIERLRVTSAGDLGIGTTTPAGSLHVVGTTPITFDRFLGSSANLRIRTANGSVTAPTAISNANNIGNLSFAGYNGSGFYEGAKIFAHASENYTSTAGGTSLMFSTTAIGTVNALPRVTISPSGFVGIGTTTPTTKLEINNGATAGAIKIVDGSQGDGKVLTSDANGVGTWKTPGSKYYQSNTSTNTSSTVMNSYVFVKNNIFLAEAGTYLVSSVAHFANTSAGAAWFNVTYSTSNTTYSAVAATPAGIANLIPANSQGNITGMNIIQVSGPTTLYQWASSSGNSWTCYGNGVDGESTIIAIKLN